MKLTPEKLEGWGYCMVKTADRQTDGQTGGIAIAYTRYSYAVARKNGASYDQSYY